ncbi:MAG: porin family protein [Alphaproteobacteria bacterium]|nr:porin family protein [Alphaproteobacteria bacterium]GIK80135.1 MAG: membrane protein [Alphaproteobacteria bacterium]
MGEHMRRLTLALIAATALALGATAASAADLGRRPVYKAPPAPVPVAYNWSGFYVGGHLGYGWGNNEVTDLLTGVKSNLDSDGFLGGAQIGLNWQTGAFVFGIEGDWSWTNADGSTAIPGAIVNADHNWYGTATARVGYAFDNMLWYVKGGAAWMDSDYSIGGLTVSDTRTGWTVGTGLEWAISPNWSAKLEYNYLDFGADRVSPLAIDVDSQAHLVKLGLNYRFGASGPVVTRY